MRRTSVYCRMQLQSKQIFRIKIYARETVHIGNADMVRWPLTLRICAESVSNKNESVWRRTRGTIVSSDNIDESNDDDQTTPGTAECHFFLLFFQESSAPYE